MSTHSKNLYNSENIIGYTGDINNDPSIYFRKGNQYGVIAKNLEKKNEVENEMVRAEYRMINSTENQNLNNHNQVNLFHQSKDPIKQINSTEQIQLLTNAIS